jgi:hypothetical protein
MYFFRTFKKSTAPYKVHNMGLRYIKIRIDAAEERIKRNQEKGQGMVLNI